MADFPDHRSHPDLADLYGAGLAGRAAVRPGPAPARRRRRPRRLVTVVLLIAGLGLIAGGVYVIAVPLIGVWQRGNAAAKALQDWTDGGSQALVGGVGESH